MKLLLFMLGGFGVMVFSYLLTTFFMRRRNGLQPSYTGLLIMVTSMGCLVAAFYVLRRFWTRSAIAQPRDTFWLGSVSCLSFRLSGPPTSDG